MSTEFTETVSGETFFVRFYGGPARGSVFEFGTMTNFENVCRMFDNGFEFESVYGDSPFGSRQDVEDAVVAGRVTFGEFPVTVAVGSGEMFRFGVEE